MRINTSKVCLVKCRFSGLRTPVDRAIFFLVSSLTQVYYFSRKSRSKYLMDTIDFDKHDIDIFINLVKIVRYGRHCRDDHAMNDDYYFDGNFPNVKLRPYDDYKNMSTLNTYYGILSTLYIITIKQLLLLIEFFVQVNQARWDKRLCNQNKNSIIRRLACNM
jgi:hypothetical protein